MRVETAKRSERAVTNILTDTNPADVVFNTHHSERLVKVTVAAAGAC